MVLSSVSLIWSGRKPSAEVSISCSPPSGWKRKTLYQRGAAAAAGIVALSEFTEL